MNLNPERQSMVAQLLPWKKHLVIIGVVAVLLAALFSSPLFITPLFQSQARVYPVNLKAFSEESESEQMLEVMTSSDLKRKMVEIFNLTDRYRIKSEKLSAQSLVLKEYDRHVSCSKTRYETIEISVLDAEPEVACAMVDSLVDLYNAKMLDMFRNKYLAQLKGYQTDLARKQAEVDTLNTRMESYRIKYGLLDYESQIMQLTSGYAEVLARNAPRSAVVDIENRLKVLAEKGGVFQEMQSNLAELQKQRDGISAKVEEALSLVNREENFFVLVEAPFAADKKSYPTRWIIVLATLLSVEFLAVLAIFVFESLSNSKS